MIYFIRVVQLFIPSLKVIRACPRCSLESREVNRFLHGILRKLKSFERVGWFSPFFFHDVVSVFIFIHVRVRRVYLGETILAHRFLVVCRKILLARRTRHRSTFSATSGVSDSTRLDFACLSITMGFGGGLSHLDEYGLMGMDKVGENECLVESGLEQSYHRARKNACGSQAGADCHGCHGKRCWGWRRVRFHGNLRHSILSEVHTVKNT